MKLEIKGRMTAVEGLRGEVNSNALVVKSKLTGMCACVLVCVHVCVCVCVRERERERE